MFIDIQFFNNNTIFFARKKQKNSKRRHQLIVYYEVLKEMDFDSGICQSVDTHEAVTQLNTEGISSYFV